MDRYVHVNNGLIGFGTLGSVSKAKDETSQQNVAIKKMQKVFQNNFQKVSDFHSICFFKFIRTSSIDQQNRKKS